MYVLVYLLMLASVAHSTTLEVETNDEASSTAALVQLQSIQKQAKHMKYGDCWTEALRILENGCRQLSDETQRRIAYSFARCHLLAAGRPIPECSKEKPMIECTNAKEISELAFTTFTEFFTHSQQICFHLQSQAWHEATELTIDRLADNSQEVAIRLEKSSEVAEKMMARQNKSLENQELLLEHEERLKISMQQSIIDVQRSHVETKKIINEQRALFHEVFDRVAVLQKTVLGEFSSIYTFGFYVGSTILAYILTSTSRTSGARIWLFLVLIFNAVTERMIADYHISDIDSDPGHFSTAHGAMIPELIQERIWLCRKILFVVAFVVLAISTYRFKDYNKINYSLLNDIKRQNQELQDYIRENIQENTMAALVTHENIHDERIGKQILFHKMCHSISDGDDTLISVDDVTMTPAIDITDINTDTTFRQSEIAESDISSALTMSSRTSISSFQDNWSRRSSTPLRQSLIDKKNSSNLEMSPSKPLSKKPKRRNSILSVLNDSVTLVSPPADSCLVGGYNLRRRPASPQVNHNALEQESVAEFTSYVLSGLAKQSASKRNQIREHLNMQK